MKRTLAVLAGMIGGLLVVAGITVDQRCKRYSQQLWR